MHNYTEASRLGRGGLRVACAATCSAHQLRHVRRRVLRLRECQLQTIDNQSCQLVLCCCYCCTAWTSGGETYQPLQALDVFPTGLVVQDMRHVVTENLFASRTLVDTNLQAKVCHWSVRSRREATARPDHEAQTDHGNSNRPRRVPNRQAEVRVVGFEVLADLHVVSDLGDREEDVGRELALPERFEQRLEVLGRGLLRRGGDLALSRAADRFWKKWRWMISE